MIALKIGNLDVSKWIVEEGLDVGYEVLLSDKSGRNARGTNRVEIVARKMKITAKFRALTQAQIAQFLAAVEPYVFDVTFCSPQTGELKTIHIYRGSLTIGFSKVDTQDFSRSMMREFDLSFIEM